MDLEYGHIILIVVVLVIVIFFKNGKDIEKEIKKVVTIDDKGRIKVVYLSGPHRSSTSEGVCENIKRSENFALRLWRQGYAVICPHKNSSFSENVCLEVFIKGHLEILTRCDAVLIYHEKYHHSHGTLIEIEEANKLGIPVYYSLEDLFNSLKR